MKEILAYRNAKFQKLIEEKGLAAILFIFPNRDGFDLYFTGEAFKTVAPYDHHLQSMDSCVLIKKGDKPTIIHASYLTAPGEEAPLLTHMAPPAGEPDDYRWCLNQKAELYIDALAENRKLGLVNPDDLRDEFYEHIVKYVPDTEFIDVTDEANALKAEKCEGDIEIERIAARKLDNLFYGMNAFIVPGRSERDLMVELLSAGQSTAAPIGNILTDWLNIDIASAPDGGESAEMPAKFPGKLISIGDRVNIRLIAALEKGYSAGLGRCFTLGEASEETKKYWSLAIGAQDAAASAIKPGAAIADAVKAAKAFYAENELEFDDSNWIFGLGLNFAMAEFPMAIPFWEDMPLKEGMFLCIAPKVKPEGKDAYCCMDTYLVTKDGCERLTKFRREIVELFNIKY